MMSIDNYYIKVKSFFQRLKGNTLEFDLTLYSQILDKINLLKSEFETISNNELKKLSTQLKEKAQNGGCLDDLIIEAYGLVRETIRRVLKVEPFDVQLIGGIVMHLGKVAEMKTGEGKTLTAVFPVYLNALSGKGVHVLTFNDYLARRDAHWMGPVYQFLGLRVGIVHEGMSVKNRQRAYNSDITYLTAKESGFDFLRDSLCIDEKNTVHRPLNYALIDEADAILIDEARIPLIIAGTSKETISDPYRLAQIVQKLKNQIDFEFDEYERNIHLTERGLKSIEKLLNCDNLYNKENIELLTRLNCAIHAEYLLHRDIDYIVRNGKVELVDEFTGRVVDKRRWPDGLQAALEAKENLAIQSKGHILNSITLQHYLQHYPKIGGMTATTQGAEKEFQQFYHLGIVVIPPNKTPIRKDYPDNIYTTKKAKQESLIREIIQVHQTKRPILVGTRSVEESANLAEALQKRGVQCEVLNAKQDEAEAKIIAQAGSLGAVTISTNMAGRGVDIKLGGKDESEKEAVVILGGLYVIGSNRHESQRIDNQLRGRGGRQGDPGSSRFFISLEDDLFIKYRLKELFPAHLVLNEHDGQISHKIVKREVDRLQRIIEGQNLEIKKTLYQYTFLIEKQRKLIFEQRERFVKDHSFFNFYHNHASKKFEQLLADIGQEKLFAICRQISLYCLNHLWSQYLTEIDDIREGIHLVRLGGQMPILEFHKQAIGIFQKYQKMTDHQMIGSFNRIKIKGEKVDLSDTGIKIPSATWTYLINDNPFEDSLGTRIMGNLSLSIGAGLWAPLVFIYSLFQKVWRKRIEKNDNGYGSLNIPH